MKFAFAAALVASAAAVAQAANEDALAQISQHWDAIVSVINADLPVLKGINPEIFAQATSVIGGTSLDAPYDEELVQHVATGISPAIMNPVLQRAGVTGVTLDGNPLPTGGSDGDSSETAQQSSTAEDTASASETPASSSSEEEQQSSSSPVSSDSSDVSSSSDASDSSDADSSDSEEDTGSDSDTSDTSDTSGAAKKLAAGSVVAAVAVVAALF